jgi:hypothetical protein
MDENAGEETGAQGRRRSVANRIAHLEVRRWLFVPTSQDGEHAEDA